MIPINFIISQRLKYVYFTRYELLKFNNYFVRIAAQKINAVAKHRLPFCKKMNF
jgi:hypothetical protein